MNLNKIIKIYHRIRFPLFLSILILCSSLAIYYLRYHSKTIQAPIQEPINISGQVIDSMNNQPIANLIVKNGQKQSITSQEGTFSFDQINPESALIVQGENIYQPLEIPVNHRQNLTIYLNKDLLQLIQTLEQAEIKRDYRKIYDLFSSRIQAKYDLNQYLSKKNQWRDQIVDQRQYQQFQVEYVTSSITPTKNDRIKLNAIYQWSQNPDSGSFDQYPVQLEFIIEDQQWRLNHDLIFELD